MQIHLEEIRLATDAPVAIIDVTDRIKAISARNPIRDGQLTVASSHTTSFVALNEREPMLQRDMLDFLARLVPPRADYLHNRVAVDGRPNAHSHLIGLFMNASETILIADGKLLLGDWQSVFFVELDGPRDERLLRVQILGIS